MAPIRRLALVEAAIREIGQAGTLNVTVGQIANRAGVSSALAHHYFGSKDEIFLAAMRHILSNFGQSVRSRLQNAAGPQARLEAIIDACFGDDQFEPDVIAAWLMFYVRAQTSPPTARLLRVYRKRLHTNLMHELRQLLPRPKAYDVAVTIGALIDGVYLRCALPGDVPDRARTIAIITDDLDRALTAVIPTHQPTRSAM
ncbi:MAG: transcriptional regulator BetI [Pseudomonadota bacterium]